MNTILYNVLTSACFAFTGWYAARRQCPDIQWGCTACLITSWLYHGGRLVLPPGLVLHVIRWIDILCWHASVLYFLWICACWDFMYFMSVLAAFCSAFIHCRYDLTNEQHSVLHVIANLGIVCLIESVSDKYITVV